MSPPQATDIAVNIDENERFRNFMAQFWGEGLTSGVDPEAEETRDE